MKKSGIVGSASVVLVFASLCLTIFTLISLSATSSEKALSDAAVQMARNYYEADLLAEFVLADIMEAPIIPDETMGIKITVTEDFFSSSVSYACPVSETKELFVQAEIIFDQCNILDWYIRDLKSWESEDSNPEIFIGDINDLLFK